MNVTPSFVSINHNQFRIAHPRLLSVFVSCCYTNICFLQGLIMWQYSYDQDLKSNSNIVYSYSKVFI